MPHAFYASEDAYLAHSYKGLSRRNHKYILRIKTDKGYRYFYSKAEVDAYMKKLKANRPHSRQKNASTESEVTAEKGRAIDLSDYKDDSKEDKRSDKGWAQYRKEAKREGKMIDQYSNLIPEQKTLLQKVEKLDKKADKADEDYAAGRISKDEYYSILKESERAVFEYEHSISDRYKKEEPYELRLVNDKSKKKK